MYYYYLNAMSTCNSVCVTHGIRHCTHVRPQSLIIPGKSYPYITHNTPILHSKYNNGNNIHFILNRESILMVFMRNTCPNARTCRTFVLAPFDLLMLRNAFYANIKADMFESYHTILGSVCAYELVLGYITSDRTADGNRNANSRHTLRSAHGFCTFATRTHRMNIGFFFFTRLH